MKTIAIDYGTSNCAVAFVKDGLPFLVELELDSTLLPSVLWVPRAPVRDVNVLESEVERIAAQLRQENAETRRERDGDGPAYNMDDNQSLIVARNIAKREAMRDAIDESKAIELSARLIRGSDVLLGSEAVRMHREDPTLGYLVKSPKNFLAVELRPEQRELFIAITSVFLRQLRTCAEAELGAPAEFVVLGRPVKYHGAGTYEPVALDIMRRAAEEACIVNFAFEYEPIAAAVAYEQQLDANKTVLVLDAGGGTTDCTMMRLGPERCAGVDRKTDILSTSGERLGGTDLDVTFAKQFFGPVFGIGAQFKSGRSVPKSGIIDALTITDIPAQTRFYGRAMATELKDYLRDTVHVDPIERLIELREKKLGMRVNRSAESAKIALSDRSEVTVELDYFTRPVRVPVTRDALEKNMHHYMQKTMALVKDVCSQSDDAPDEIFITGGTSKIPLLKRVLSEHFPTTPIVSGDIFGSVAKGLALRAAVLGSAM